MNSKQYKTTGLNTDIELDLEVIEMTKHLILVSNGDVETWIERSKIQCDDEIEVGLTTTFTINERLAIESELV